MSNPKACILYSLIRILADEKVFVDYDTLQPLPIITQHLMETSNACPDVVMKHELHFSGPDSEAKKVAFMSKPMIRNAMQNYIDMFLRDKPGPMPSLPKWEDSIPEIPMSSEAMDALYYSEKKERKRTRKQQKSRKQTRKQQKKQIKRK